MMVARWILDLRTSLSITPKLLKTEGKQGRGAAFGIQAQIPAETAGFLVVHVPGANIGVAGAVDHGQKGHDGVNGVDALGFRVFMDKSESDSGHGHGGKPKPQVLAAQTGEATFLIDCQALDEAASRKAPMALNNQIQSASVFSVLPESSKSKGRTIS